MIMGRIVVTMEAIVSVATAIAMNASTVVPLKRGCGISHQSAVWLPGAVDTDRRRRHVTAGRSIRPIVQSAPFLYEPVADDSSATPRPLCSTCNVVYVRRALPRPGFTREVEQRGRKKTNVGSPSPATFVPYALHAAQSHCRVDAVEHTARSSRQKGGAGHRASC